MTRTLLSPSYPDERAEQAIELALELVDAVRCWRPRDVQTVIDRADPAALLVVLAAMVDDSRPVKDLLSWVPEKRQQARRRGVLQPCGTHAAHNRHVKRGEPIDPLCLMAERRYQRERDRRRRTPAPAPAPA